MHLNAYSPTHNDRGVTPGRATQEGASCVPNGLETVQIVRPQAPPGAAEQQGDAHAHRVGLNHRPPSATAPPRRPGPPSSTRKERHAHRVGLNHHPSTISTT